MKTIATLLVFLFSVSVYSQTDITEAEQWAKEEGISGKYGLHLTLTYLKHNQKSKACEVLSRMAQFSPRSNEKNFKAHSKAMRIKDTMCVFVAKKSNKVPAFNLLSLSETSVASILGNPTGKTLEHRGKESYDANVYQTKWGKYHIIFKDSNAWLVFIYPTIEQSYNEDELFSGGKFNTDNDNDFLMNNCYGTTQKGFVNKVHYFSVNYDCAGGEHAITYYGQKNGNVTKVLVY